MPMDSRAHRSTAGWMPAVGSAFIVISWQWRGKEILLIDLPEPTNRSKDRWIFFGHFVFPLDVFASGQCPLDRKYKADVGLF
jgi:hypothetical protein